MSKHIWPLQALLDEVQATLATAAERGGTAPAAHLLGEKYLDTHGTPPRYVWVPKFIRESRDPVTQSVDEVRSVAWAREHVSIYCWGATYNDASALRSNVIAAMKRAAAVDLTLEGGDWVHPSQGWNQKGELFRLEVSLEIPFVDDFIPLTTLEQPEASIADIEAVDVALFKSPDPEHDGDAFITFNFEGS